MARLAASSRKSCMAQCRGRSVKTLTVQRGLRFCHHSSLSRDRCSFHGESNLASSPRREDHLCAKRTRRWRSQSWGKPRELTKGIEPIKYVRLTPHAAFSCPIWASLVSDGVATWYRTKVDLCLSVPSRASKQGRRNSSAWILLVCGRHQFLLSARFIHPLPPRQPQRS